MAAHLLCLLTPLQWELHKGEQQRHNKVRYADLLVFLYLYFLHVTGPQNSFSESVSWYEQWGPTVHEHTSYSRHFCNPFFPFCILITGLNWVWLIYKKVMSCPYVHQLKFSKI